MVYQTAQGASNTILHGNGSGAPTFSAVDLTTEVTGVLPVPNGGTGLATITQNGILMGNGASAVSALTGTNYQVLRVPSGGGAPAFGAIDISQAAAVTGTLAIGNGGTGGIASPTSGAVAYGNGTSYSFTMLVLQDKL